MEKNKQTETWEKKQLISPHDSQCRANPAFDTVKNMAR